MARFEFPKTPLLLTENRSDWNSWQWQMRAGLKTLNDFENIFSLSEDEKSAFQGAENTFNVRVTPYYASLADRKWPEDPIRKILMPHLLEKVTGFQQMLDPLGERKNNPVPRVVHRYSDRCLLLITDICSVYCRFCTRKHFTGQEQAFLKNNELENALNYIKSKPGIREVLITGGDPLTVSDQQLDRVLFELRQIPSVEIIRIGTRMPVVAPQRITEDLVKILKKHKPVFMMTHFNHPRELTFEAAEALERLVDNGVPTFNQMVLLNGVNNHEAIVQALSRRLLFLRVKPYYMFQCDPSEGTDHLRTSIEDSLQIQRNLWGHLSGLAIPHYSIDIPNGGGKAYKVPDFETSREENIRKFKGWDGVEEQYISPPKEKIKKPLDWELYQNEWLQIQNSKK
ncbi:MAG: KamA family radical SAM protein [Bdellovibrionales bacterium]